MPETSMNFASEQTLIFMKITVIRLGCDVIVTSKKSHQIFMIFWCMTASENVINLPTSPIYCVRITLKSVESYFRQLSICASE